MPSIMCPHCHRSYNAPDKAIGRKVKCPGCQSEFTAQPKANPIPDTVKMTAEEIERYYGKKIDKPSA